MERQQRGVFLSSDYYEDLVVWTYDDRVKGNYPAHLSDSAKRWEWTVESYARNVTPFKAMRKVVRETALRNPRICRAFEKCDGRNGHRRRIDRDYFGGCERQETDDRLGPADRDQAP